MANRALLVMDVQRDIVGVADDGSGYLPRLRRAIDGARAANIPVIYVVIALRPGFPEVGSRNRALAVIAREAYTSRATPAPRSTLRSRPGPVRWWSSRGGRARSRAAISTWC
ncbi:hypothetical protein GCM10010274_59810 [Streptomyces lavendofoliae]|uniref:Isochorismatase family protein n=1 Tax=Streptomyces lavendofoliae TaxID=67314 RepID=A0A918I3G2_9ACTN|nr:hypothetical protein GCM10010274_59810 [Streptomyces lavendofoliae]